MEYYKALCAVVEGPEKPCGELFMSINPTDLLEIIKGHILEEHNILWGLFLVRDPIAPCSRILKIRSDGVMRGFLTGEEVRFPNHQLQINFSAKFQS